LDLEALMDLDEIEEDIYMCRAQWKHREGELEPPMNLWRKGCICNSIINPDIPFKICTDCNVFLHVKCLESQSSSVCNSCGKEL